MFINIKNFKENDFKISDNGLPRIQYFILFTQDKVLSVPVSKVNFIYDNCFFNISAKYKLIFIYFYLIVENYNTPIAYLDSEIEKNIKINIINYINSNNNKDYYFDYVSFYKYINDNFNKIHNYIFYDGKIYSYIFNTNYKELSKKNNLENINVEKIISTENGLENLLNIVNMINNDNISIKNINTNFNLLIKYKISECINFYNNNNNENIFNDELKSNIDDNFIKLNLEKIIDILIIDKYVSNHDKIPNKLNDILICLIYCTSKDKYNEIKGKIINIDIIEILNYFFFNINNKQYGELYKTLIYNSLIKSDINISIEIFEKFSRNYENNNYDGFYISEI